MIVTDFKENYKMYENMSIWVVNTLEEFFKAHEFLLKIFENEYRFPYDKRNEQVNPFDDADIMVISKLLDHFGDKQFFVFSQNDPHHKDLIAIQEKKIVNFGIDITTIDANRIYVLEMDKTKDLAMYDK